MFSLAAQILKPQYSRLLPNLKARSRVCFQQPTSLGRYDAKDRKLAVNEQDAAIIRALFELYIERGSTRLVAQAAAARGYCTPKRLAKSGVVRGGRPLSRGHIDQILTNRVYLGEIPYKDQSYPGAHDPIIDNATWERAQALRRRNCAAHRTKINARHPSLLAGLLFDPWGAPMTATHASKGGKRYRYYVSRPLVRGDATDEPRGLRLPAADIEALVTTKIVGWLKDANAVIDALASGHPQEMAAAAEGLAKRIEEMAVGDCAAVLSEICERIDSAEDAIRIKLRSQRLLSALGQENLGPTGP